MANLICNISLGRIVELYNRVDTNDPANSALVITVFDASAGVEATIEAAVKDADTLAAIEAITNLSEVTNTNYARKVLTDADIVAFAPDDVNDRVDLDIPDQTWTAVAAGSAWTDLNIGYDPDSTLGTDADIVPGTWHDFVVTPNGGDITAQIAAAGFARFQ